MAHTVKRFEGQVHELVINANRNSDAYALFADRVIEDAEGGFKGPLMGIYSGLRAAQLRGCWSHPATPLRCPTIWWRAWSQVLLTRVSSTISPWRLMASACTPSSRCYVRRWLTT